MDYTKLGSNARFDYPGYHNAPSFCHVDLYNREDDRTVIVATELADNPGTSVTNRCEVIASRIAEGFGVKPKDVIFIENYDDRSYHGGRPNLGKPETSLVTFTWDGWTATKPEWKHVSSVEAVLTGVEG